MLDAIMRTSAGSRNRCSSHILTSLPIEGDAGTTEDDLPFKPWNCLLGVVLSVSGLAHMFRPHRALFLVDSFWIACLGGWTLFRLFSGGHWTWTLMLIVEACLIVNGLNQYRHFKHMHQRVEGKGA